MIVLFTDFGLAGPYTGQVKAVLYSAAPDQRVVDLFADAPCRNPKAAAYLLAAYTAEFPSDAVFLCVVDPGVGGARAPLAVQADGRWFVGPDNGLFELVVRRATQVRCWRITWRPDRLSPSFHGRDLFAPVAARIARGEGPPGEELATGTVRRADWPDDLWEIVYVDGYGNAMTGIRAASLSDEARLGVAGRTLGRVQTFSGVEPGAAFWYENANGLVEIAVNMGSARAFLDIDVGAEVIVC